MKADGSVIIDTKIIDGGMEKGFEQLKTKMNSVGVAAEKVGDKIKMSFSGDVTAPIQNAVAKVQELEQKLEVATEGFYNAVYADDDKGAEKWARKRETVYARLEAAQRRLTQVVVSETNREAKAQERSYRKATKAVRSFGKRLTGVVSSALVFSLISRGLRQVTEYMGKALKTNKQFVETSNKMKGAFLTAFQPLYETLLPAIISGMEVIAKYALVIGRFFSSLTGKNTDQMKENAKALYEQADATEAVGDAAKKASQQIGGFDELNAMQNQDGGGSADFNLEGIDLSSKLTEMVVIGSEALLALGVLLSLSGVNIPLGISMIAFGAAGMYQSIAENWGKLGNRVGTALDVILTIIYQALFVFGFVIALCVPTKLGLGIGMIIAGATGLASEVGLNWNYLKESLQSPMGALVGLLAGAILVVFGIIACVGGALPLGIGLIIEGAAFLATTVAVNWNAIIETLRGPIGEIVALVSTAILAIGIILCFAGVFPLGIGLIVAGAAGLATTVAVNWNAIIEALRGPIGAIVALVSGSLLVLGIILCCVGIYPLGIGLIVAGAAGLATTVAVNWNSIIEALRGPIGAIVALVSTAILAIGIILCFAGVFPLGIGLIVAGAAGLATTVAVNWNAIIEALRGPIGAIVALVSGSLLVLGIILCCVGIYPLGIGLIVAGAAGLATTVAVNWNSIIEALRGPIGAIVALVSGSLLVLGIILCCVGVFPLGIGLIVAGAAGLAAVVAVNWNVILDKVKEIWQGVKNYWNQNIAPVFTKKWWADLAKSCGNGLITGFEKAINGIISLFETMINWIVGGLNKIGFDIPDWVPGIGGKTFGFNIPEVKFGRVSIPRLAEGAVIPPNKEFMAVLGDQRHGTNIEAPLATIEEAVARVTGEQSERMVAALYTLIEIVEQKDLSVQIGDDDIGRANDRYKQTRGAQVNYGAFSNAY